MLLFVVDGWFGEFEKGLGSLWSFNVLSSAIFFLPFLLFLQRTFISEFKKFGHQIFIR